MAIIWTWKTLCTIFTLWVHTVHLHLMVDQRNLSGRAGNTSTLASWLLRIAICQYFNVDDEKVVFKRTSTGRRASSISGYTSIFASGTAEGQMPQRHTIKCLDLIGEEWELCASASYRRADAAIYTLWMGSRSTKRPIGGLAGDDSVERKS